MRQVCLPGFHKLTLTILKAFHTKHKSKIIQYRVFNHFDKTIFRDNVMFGILGKIQH